jgi:RNA:NAD 2'-phosphotransferase (TPT1/KptA family)
MKDRHVRTSKFLSLVLRHQPEKLGLTPDREGWVPVSRLLEALEAHGRRVTPDELREVVFFRSANGVWLTEHVPARYITFGDGDSR